jgi:hypothetical protein
MIRSLLPLVTIALLGFAPGSNAGDVNKCVDADGKVSYSSQPCPQDATAERVKIRKAPSSDDEASREEDAGEPGSMKKLRERIAATDDPVHRAQLELTLQQCELANTQLQRYADAPYLVRQNDDGTKTRLSDEEAEAEKANLQQFLASDCT